MRFTPSFALLASLTVLAGSALGQDPRNVQEPIIPPVCTTLTALLTSGTAVGTLSSETQLDSPRIQAALNACTAGQAVELAPAPGADAYLVGPVTIPSGVTLLVDAGVTVYASRNPHDFDTGSNLCGTLDTKGSGCNPVFSLSNTSGSGIMGYGTIDGRGYMPMLINGQPGESWWQLANDADTQGLDQNNPRLINMSKADRVTLYKIRLMNSPMFHVDMDTSSNFTAWGVKIVAPYDARNSDGIDPNYSTNVTITQSHISDGDDHIAIGGNKVPGAHYYTVTNDWFGNGHGLSIGSYTLGTVDHLLAQNLTFSGLASDSNGTSVHIKSDVSRGGVVQDLSYSNICIDNVRYPIWLDPFYSGLTKTGTLLPWYKNISISNLHSVTEGQVIIQGYNSSVPTEASLSNVVVDGIQAQDFISKYKVTTPTNAILALGPDPVNFAQYLSGPGVTVINNISDNNPPYSCPANVFAPIAGELIPGPAQVDPGTQLNLQVQVFTTRAVPYATYLANLANNPYATLALTPPTGRVTVFEGKMPLGYALLNVTSNNGMEQVTVPVQPLSPGVHTLQAQYSGDANYPLFDFGSYNVTVGQGQETQTTLTATSTSLTAGEPVTLTAAVAAPGKSIASGSVKFTAGSVNLGTAATGANGTAMLTTSSLTPGTYSVLASFTGYQSSDASQSSALTITVAKIPTTLSLSPTRSSTTVGQPVTLTATVQDGASTTLLPSGTVTILDGTATLATLPVVNGAASVTTSTLAAGNHSLSATFSGDGNFLGAAGTATVTINPAP